MSVTAILVTVEMITSQVGEQAKRILLMIEVINYITGRQIILKSNWLIFFIFLARVIP